MTTTLADGAAPSWRDDASGGPVGRDDGRPDPEDVRARPPRDEAMRAMLIMVTLIALGLFLYVVLVTGLQHHVSQIRAFDKLRGELANGVAPVAGIDANGHPVAMGAPIAVLDIPTIHVHEVVFEGTTGGVLMAGPGHRRGTPFPGHLGTSVILGRRAAYGGPFKHLSALRPGASVVVTTGGGVSHYKVIDIRRAGDPAPSPLAAGQGRLLLMTATGPAFMPSGVLRADADLVSRPVDQTTIGTGSVPAAEQPLGTDSSTVWALVLWLQVLVVVSLVTVWSWLRWGRAQTWIVLAPVTLLVVIATAGEVVRLLPNLM
jgi:LPXTG-site transpeptidase (sortase) family protein